MGTYTEIYVNVDLKDDAKGQLVGSDVGLDNDRMCKCRHGINWHKDFDFDIHECTFHECSCQQFNDIDD